MLQRPVRVTDQAGYEQDIIAAAVDEGSRRIAWVETRARAFRRRVDVEFRLRAQVGDQRVIDWEVETYNPFFGCQVGYMAWHGNRLVLVYREKHHTYACSFPLAGAKARIQIDDEWLLGRDQIISISKDWDHVDRLSLPELAKLESVSAEDARSQGLLPARFDKVVRRRKVQSERLRDRSIVKPKHVSKKWWRFW